MPDPDRPSSAPLSEADADRLSERFTASWDEPEPLAPPVSAPPVSAPPAPAPMLAPAPMPAPAPTPVSAPPSAASAKSAFGGQTAPLPAVQPQASTEPKPGATPFMAPAAPRPPTSTAGPTPAPPTPLTTKPKPKQTLLGIAPIVVVGPSEPPPAKPEATPSVSPPPTSSAEVTSSPTATAVTTPSKPYVPKDHPATPAVVISGDVISAEAPTPSTRPKEEDRARIAQTIPGQTRSSPMAALTPLPAAAISASATPALSTLDDTYPPARQRGSKLPWVLGGLAVIAAVGIGVTKLGAGPSAEAGDAASSRARSVEPPAAGVPSPPPPVAAAPAEPAVPSRPSAPEPASDTARSAAEAAPAPEPPVRKSKVTRKVSAAPAPRRPAARPEPKTASTPAPEPAPAPKPAKGVIVRETPF